MLLAKDKKMSQHDAIKEKLRKFANERDWDKFHNPKNLSMSLSVEVSELVEIFQWLSPEESNNLNNKQKAKVDEELADVFLYLLRISDVVGVDLFDAANRKIKLNAMKYPISNSYGNATKYSDK